MDDSLKWFKLKSLPQLGFDHLQIIHDAYDDVKTKIVTDPLIFDFVPIKFTLNELQVAYETILDVELDNRNFRKKVSSKSYIFPLDEKQKGVSKKPSRLYMFSKDVYNQVVKTDFIIHK